MFIARRVWGIFFIIFFAALIQTEVFAIELTLPNTVVNPDKYLIFQVKRLIEKATIFIKFSKESKKDYYKDLTLKRMAELKYVVEKNLLGEVETSTQRLSYQVGILSDYLNANQADLPQERQMISDLLSSYISILENLRDRYPANSSFWMLVQHSINSIDLNLEKLK